MNTHTAAAFLIATLALQAGTAFAQKDKDSKPKSTTVRVLLAQDEKEKDYTALWEKTAAKGSPEEYLKASQAEKEQAMHFGDLIVEMFYPQMKKADHYRLYDLRPWIVHLDINEREVAAAPGSWVCLSPYELFDKPLPPSQTGGPNVGGIVAVVKLDEESDGPACEIKDITCTPAWEMEPDAVVNKWFTHPPSNRDIGFARRSIWLRVPENTPVGKHTLNLTATATGPKDGKAAHEIPIKETLTLNVTAAAPAPGRPQALGLWAQAVHLQTQEKEKKDSPRLKAWLQERQRIHAILKAAAATGGESGALAADLLSRAPYTAPEAADSAGK